ncbi:carboxypeptidase M32 [Paenibacillus thermoaerophilus]|uniref:Metal-dependent carboxypeptidase n=1 Tax=Paenibacillus thermoaerophilus TaxID=1215385 RepID=A0ABW2V7R1_9BACL|nr:carboxypeptidase M32 [Paenibacillus thermoaerophilus]TMV17103.1 carboxypeptidase M32 [Paenibacillus thermoaerophilus]
MSEPLEAKRQEFRIYLRKIRSYEEALGVLYWDLRTGAPKKGADMRSEVIGSLSGEMFRLSVAPQMEEFLNYFEQSEIREQLSEVDRVIVRECRKEFDRSRKIPPERYEEYVVLTSQAETVWEEAKKKSDFAMFKPYLEKVVAFNREFIGLWGYEGHPYNTLLDMYEPGMTVDKLDRVFGELREKLVPLSAAIRERGDAPDTSMLRQTFDKDRQKQFSLMMLGQLGYDFDAGRLDESVHPFATGLNPGDVRITTRYLENDVVSALFGTIHECGHALYEQNISTDLYGTPLCTGTSMGIHESQSRFWENMIGRSRPFWQRYFPDLKKLYPEQLANADAESFYRAINVTKPSLIRIEADELTYNLHIMIRYELEKALFGGELAVEDLPRAWNAKYAEYLGIEPSNDGEGVLQDVHWSSGGFGYFPSYALGNMYAAQFMQAMRRELGDIDALVGEGRFAPIKDWLVDKIYRYGKLQTPGEIVSRVTGEELNPSYLIAYLEEKYRDIYKL